MSLLFVLKGDIASSLRVTADIALRNGLVIDWSGLGMCGIPAGVCRGGLANSRDGYTMKRLHMVTGTYTAGTHLC